MARYRLTQEHEDTLDEEVFKFSNKDDLIAHLMALVDMTSNYNVDLEKEA